MILQSSSAQVRQEPGATSPGTRHRDGHADPVPVVSGPIGKSAFTIKKCPRVLEHRGLDPKDVAL